MNVFIGVVIGFLLGAVLASLVSRFLTQYEAFKTKTEDKLKQAKEDIGTIEDEVQENRDRQEEKNAAFDERIKQAEDTITALTRALMAKERGRRELYWLCEKTWYDCFCGPLGGGQWSFPSNNSGVDVGLWKTLLIFCAFPHLRRLPRRLSFIFYLLHNSGLFGA